MSSQDHEGLKIGQAQKLLKLKASYSRPVYDAGGLMMQFQAFLCKKGEQLEWMKVWFGQINQDPQAFQHLQHQTVVLNKHLLGASHNDRII